MILAGKMYQPSNSFGKDRTSPLGRTGGKDVKGWKGYERMERMARIERIKNEKY